MKYALTCNHKLLTVSCRVVIPLLALTQDLPCRAILRLPHLGEKPQHISAPPAPPGQPDCYLCGHGCCASRSSQPHARHANDLHRRIASWVPVAHHPGYVQRERVSKGLTLDLTMKYLTMRAMAKEEAQARCPPGQPCWHHSAACCPLTRSHSLEERAAGDLQRCIVSSRYS